MAGMKTLANANDKIEIQNRLRKVSPRSRRRWGEMTPHQMICHLSDAFRSCLGEREVRPASRWIPRTPFRWAALWLPMPWPHGVQGPPEWDPKAQGTQPKEFESDRKELKKLIDRYTKPPRGFEWPAHPFFGRMSHKDWMRLGYLHLDHHLRQFGA
jgi:Protein of unknown function (DUF1569)